MNRLLIANRDTHSISDEANQLHAGLRHAGWIQPEESDVAAMLDKYRPDVVYIDDPREWRNDCSGHPQGLEFSNWQCLKENPQITKVTTVKDAGTLTTYQREFAEAIGAKIVVTYYHENAILPLCPWLASYKIVRTYHSVDAVEVGSYSMQEPRERCVVSGMTGPYYPLRNRVIAAANELDCDVFNHPGYRLQGSQTSAYLAMLHGYKVSIATASKFGFALRKIIESAAMGCTVITDLPEFDVPPDINLVRVSPDISIDDLRRVIDHCECKWSAPVAWQSSLAACAFYDWRKRGVELSLSIESIV